jgi:dihydroorotate dehydrogenase
MPVSLQRFMYKLFRNILFLFPPESVHHFSMNLLELGSKIGFVQKILKARFSVENPAFQKEFLGLTFSNPIGLAAGFDKNALYLSSLATLGFGSVEIGTVTPLAQPGNEKPRLFRLKKDLALINRMGFNNDGVAIVAERIKSWKQLQDQRMLDKAKRMIIGGNIGKNKVTPNEDAWKDYEHCFRALFDVVDYFVVNVSSPNTPGLRALQEKESLRKILVHLQNTNKQIARDNAVKPRPLLLKIAPDLNWDQINEVVDLAQEIHLDGLVIANTTISREFLAEDADQLERIGPGGLSGAPLKNRATEMVKYISDRTSGAIPIIASGGIFSADDAQEKFNAGAALVQVWTGFIYEGPGIVKNILSGLK